MTVRPLAVDLFTGLGGWTEGLVAEGWRVVGYDIEDMYAATGAEKHEHYELVLQDVLTIHGSQFKDAHLIVSSSPCTEYSYMAMPWSRAKAKAAAILADESGEAMRRLNELFNAQFRIQREASEAAGRHIPMIVENVRGAQRWVGPAAWNFGSYYLWGDVPALMPRVVDGRKVPGFRFDGSGGSFQSASVAAHVNPLAALAPSKMSDGAMADGRKGRGAGAGAAWFDQNISSLPSSSPRRKAASAAIAKIPLTLSRHIGRVYKP